MSVNLKKKPSSGGNQTGLKILAILLVALGLLTAFASPIAGVVLVIIGSVLLQKRARNLEVLHGQAPKAPLKRRWQIIVAAAAIVIAAVGYITPAPSITTIQVDGSPSAQVDVTETCEVLFSYDSPQASADGISCTSSDESVALTSIKSAENGVVNCVITPVKAGNVEIVCQSGEVSSAPVDVTVSDRAAEEAARLAEEQAKKEAEEKAAKEAAEKAAAEQAAKEAAEKAAAEQAAAEQAQASQSSSGGSQSSGGGQAVSGGSSGGSSSSVSGSRSTGDTVYITPTGKRYHRSSTCGGKNSYAVDISEVGSRTPCKKCAGG